MAESAAGDSGMALLSLGLSFGPTRRFHAIILRKRLIGLPPAERRPDRTAVISTSLQRVVLVAAFLDQEGAPVSKRTLQPNTTLYPVPVVLITTGADLPNVMTCNRVASCSAEPPRLAISVRPARHSHGLIQRSGEFVVNFPTPAQATLSDYLGVVSGRDEDKIAIAGLRLAPAAQVRTPLLADCPVNIECTVEREIDLDSHSLFIGLVRAVHVEEGLLDEQGDVDIDKAIGLAYGCGTVRERPTYTFRVEDLRRAARTDGNRAPHHGNQPSRE